MVNVDEVNPQLYWRHFLFLSRWLRDHLVVRWSEGEPPGACRCVSFPCITDGKYDSEEFDQTTR